MRELDAMAEGRARCAWIHTAEIAAAIYNSQRAADTPVILPQHINPFCPGEYSPRAGVKIHAGNIDTLTNAFVAKG